MRGIRKLALGLICVAGLCLLSTAGASGGTFAMKQCQGAFQVDFGAAFSPINGSSNFDVINGCTAAGAGKIGIYQDRSGSNLTYGDGGQFRWDTPAGIGVIATNISARLRNASGISAELIGFDGSNTDLDGGAAHDGNPHMSRWSDPSRPKSLVAARLTCDQRTCENQASSTKAFLEVTDAEFTVQDTSPPSVSASGELWDWTSGSLYHHGSAAITATAADKGSGVADIWADINGFRADLGGPICPGDRGTYATRFTPCPLTFSTRLTFNTASAPFQEGDNAIRICARDYANPETTAARTCSGVRSLKVDNRSPNPALDLHSDQGSDWRPENRFTLRWKIPGGQVAPVVGAIYQLRELASGAPVSSGYLQEDGITSAELSVPDVGAYKAMISLVDGAMNVGEAAETVLRFDDRPPGNVSPEPPSGWVSRDELPLRQEIEKAEAGGPSGISGYALAVSGDGPATPCVTDICLGPEITLSDGADARTGSIAGLSEGNHWVSAAAVSGAHRSSLEAGNTLVRVDRTPPSSSISGVPNDWVNHPVSLTVQAVDQLSGMQPQRDDDGRPVTVIAAENYAPYESPGPIATFTVATEGVNHVRYWAEDLAGNANDGLPAPEGDNHPRPGQAVVRIDTIPPTINFDQNRNPEDPEVVRVVSDDADSGVSSATVMIRKVGSSGKFTVLPTSGHDGEFEARIPSDDLERGSYELKARALDRAGNEAIGGRTLAGDPMIVSLPVKATVGLTAALNGRTMLRARYGSRPFVDGRLTSHGIALANQRIHLVETFVTGSRANTRSTEAITDGDGRYRLKLSPGPIRSVQVVFDGTEKLSRAVSSKLQLDVKGKVSFRVKPRKLYNGRTARMKGSVGFAGALPPSRGKLVAIQFFDPGRRKWRPVEVIRTTRRGRFHYTYRFRTISSAQRIVFRASVLPEAGWPYLPSTSKPRSVIVYPKG